MRGFFEPSTWQGIKQPLPLIAECGKCKLDLGCKTPYMKVDGKGKKKILIVCEAPGEHEDDYGRPLVGNTGVHVTQVLHRLGINMRRDCWLTNAVLCRPKNNRDPKSIEVDHCRPNLTRTIQILQPDIIVPMGKFAIQSLLPIIWQREKVQTMSTWAGWTIPCQQINAWVCPTYHPSAALRSDNPVVGKIIAKHLDAAMKLDGKPYPNGLPDYKKQIRCEMNDHLAANTIKTMMAFGRPMAIDIETTTLKPDGPHAEILCCSVSDGITSIAFPWFGEAIEAVKIFLRSRIPKDVSNLRFEARWFRKFLKIITRNWEHDTLLGAHVLNCAHGITSLKFQAFVLFGIPDYDSHIDPYKKSKSRGGNSPNRMRELEPQVMMEYCALDSLFEVMVSNKQREAGAMLCRKK